MDTYADDLAALVEALDLNNAIMVEHSTGGGEWEELALRVRVPPASDSLCVIRGSRTTGKLAIGIGNHNNITVRPSCRCQSCRRSKSAGGNARSVPL
jgi:hypothetical protein